MKVYLFIAIPYFPTYTNPHTTSASSIMVFRKRNSDTKVIIREFGLQTGGNRA